MKGTVPLCQLDLYSKNYYNRRIELLSALSILRKKESLLKLTTRSLPATSVSKFTQKQENISSLQKIRWATFTNHAMPTRDSTDIVMMLCPSTVFSNFFLYQYWMDMWLKAFRLCLNLRDSPHADPSSLLRFRDDISEELKSRTSTGTRGVILPLAQLYCN